MAGRSAEAGAFIDLLFVVHRILLHALVNHVDPDSLDCTRKELQVGMQIARGAICVFASKPDGKSRYEPPVFGALAAICFNPA
jgi:hypothetical protein